jgi:curved DNA-binding protein CbpA
LEATTPNYYATLGLWRDASAKEIHHAYRHLARLYHPDVNPAPEAEERFRAIQEAYDVLSDAVARKRYDASCGYGADSTARVVEETPPAGGVAGKVVWTPPWRVPGSDAEAAWIRRHAKPRLPSLRSLLASLLRLRRRIALFAGALALTIAVCALLDWIFPELGALVVVAAFTLPAFFLFAYSLSGAIGRDER